MFPYTHSLKDYLRVYNFKNVLNKKEEKMEQIEYAIWATVCLYRNTSSYLILKIKKIKLY